MRLGLEWKCEVQGGATPSLLILFFLLAQAKHTHSFTNFGGQLHHSRFFFPYLLKPSTPIHSQILGGNSITPDFFFPTCSSQAHPFIHKFWGATPSLPIFFSHLLKPSTPIHLQILGGNSITPNFFSYLLKPSTPIHSQILGGNSITPDFFFLLAQAKHTHSFTNFGGQLHHSGCFGLGFRIRV